MVLSQIIFSRVLFFALVFLFVVFILVICITFGKGKFLFLVLVFRSYNFYFELVFYLWHLCFHFYRHLCFYLYRALYFYYHPFRGYFQPIPKQIINNALFIAILQIRFMTNRFRRNYTILSKYQGNSVSEIIKHRSVMEPMLWYLRKPFFKVGLSF